jgi:hypothetical protein
MDQQELQHDNNNDNAGTGTTGPLHGVMACVTGMHSREKDELHQMIQDLGGE